MVEPFAGPRTAGAPDPGEWIPAERDGVVRLAFSRTQRARWAAVTAGVGLVLAVAAVATANVVLLAVTAALVAGSLGYAWFAGVELTPATMTVFGPSIRRRTLWARTVRWATILDIQTTVNGEVWLSLPGEPPLVVRAPRGVWVVHDPDFEDKVRFLLTWWQLHRNASARPGDVAPVDMVRRQMGFDPPSVAAPAAPTTMQRRSPETPAPDRAAPAVAPAENGLFADPLPPPDESLVDPLDAEPDDLREPARFPFALFIGFVVLSLVVGYLFLGPDLLVVAVALLVLLRFGRDPGRPLALGAFVLLALSGIATIVQGPRDSEGLAYIGLSYAAQRAVAVQAGAVVGVFLVVSTVVFAISERSPGESGRPPWRRLDRVHLTVLERILPSWLRSSVPYVIVALAGLAIRVAVSPAALPDAYRPLLANLRLGTGYSLAEPSGGIPAGQYPPLAPMLVAFSPLGPKVALLLVSTFTVIAVGWVAHRRWGRAAGILAAGIAALVPALWGAQLPVQLAGLFVLGAVAFADPVQITPQRAVGAGVCAGLAGLARPDALIAVVIIGWWIRRQRREEPSALVAYGLAALAVLIPWFTFVWSEFRSPWPMATLRATFNDPSTTHRLPGVIAVVLSLAVLVALVAVLAPQWERRFDLLPYYALPAAAAVLALTDPLSRDLLTWAAPVVAVALGRWAAPVVRTQLGPVLEVPYRDMVDWDGLVEEEQARLGGGDDWWGEDTAPIGAAPDEDQLFL